jgi:hypothetical protein
MPPPKAPIIAAEYRGDTPSAVALAENLTVDIADRLNRKEAVTIDVITAEWTDKNMPSK